MFNKIKTCLKGIANEITFMVRHVWYFPREHSFLFQVLFAFTLSSLLQYYVNTEKEIELHLAAHDALTARMVRKRVFYWRSARFIIAMLFTTILRVHVRGPDKYSANKMPGYQEFILYFCIWSVFFLSGYCY